MQRERLVPEAQRSSALELKLHGRCILKACCLPSAALSPNRGEPETRLVRVTGSAAWSAEIRRLSWCPASLDDFFYFNFVDGEDALATIENRGTGLFP